MEPAWIPLSEPHLGGNEWTYVKECLDTGWVSSVGSFVERFERETAARLGAKHAVACVNGTAALHVALRLAGVTGGDEVLVSTLTFIAPANAIRYLGAHPVFIDSEPEYGQMDPACAAEFLDRRCRTDGGGLRDVATGRRVRAILPVHILGHPVDLDPILELGRRFGLPVVEDATESLGAQYRGRAPGTFGLAGCLSFNGNKIITTGGGGMIVTNDAALAARAKHLTTQAKADPLEYIHDEVGYNYRLVNVLAALGCAQLERLDAHVEAKRRIARRYDLALEKVPGLVLPKSAPWAGSSSWLYTIRVDAGAYGEDSRSLIRRLASRRIQARPLWQPLHLSKPHGCEEALPVSERLYREAVSLPCSVGLSPGNQDRVIAEVASRSR